jgi:tripartite-type tricarboxylate transporter receptor subunit TctC
MKRAAAGFCLSLLLAIAAVAPASADDSADFYRGKTIRNIIGFGPGDSFDLYARLVARYLGAHIPGNPTIVVQNMPGAGSLNALNYVMNVAPRDGTVIGMVNPVATIQPLLQPDLVKFDPRTIDWIGSLATDYYTCGFWTADKVSLKDLQGQQVLVGSTAITGATYAGDMVFMSTLHLNFKVVPGYGDMAQLNHAAESGEVRGHCGVMATTLKSTLWQTYTDKKLQIAVRASLTADPDLPNVPNAFDLVTSEEDREVLLLLAGPWYYGRPMFAPPGLPQERLAVLRTAFEAMVKDPAFLDDAKTQRADIHPIPGSEVSDTINKIYAIPAAVLDRARPMFGITKQ